MKTSREILLGRHQAAIPELDRIRQDCVAKLRTPSLAVTAWKELIWPAYRIWLGLGAAWIFIFVLHVVSGESASTSNLSGMMAPDSVCTLQKKELMAQSQAENLAPPPSAANRPRSEIKSKFKVV